MKNKKYSSPIKKKKGGCKDYTKSDAKIDEFMTKWLY